MREEFGALPDGQTVERVRIAGGGLTAHVLSYGAVLQDLRLQGHDGPLVVGFETFAPYLTQSPYFGAMAGRCANRIRDGRFRIDGHDFQADRNFLGKHCLHGGSAGFGKRLWTIDDLGPSHVMLSLVSAHGDMGFPGQLTARVVFSLPGQGVFDIAIEAETDTPTLCSLAHHSYWNLGGRDILDHVLTIDADNYTETDAELIPTGRSLAVDGDLYDFRQGRALREVTPHRPVDTNFCVTHDRRTITPMAWLSNPVTGLSLEIRSTEPGLQVFDGDPFGARPPGLDGQNTGRHCGLALEPQLWPDAINHPDWAQPILRPGETYRQHSQFVLRKA